MFDVCTKLYVVSSAGQNVGLEKSDKKSCSQYLASLVFIPPTNQHTAQIIRVPHSTAEEGCNLRTFSKQARVTFKAPKASVKGL